MIIKNMKETILNVEGIQKNSLGISANQIGYDKRIILITKYPTIKLMKKFFEALINPEILEYSEDKSLKWEACLSYPK
jgi:peptide deformylase